MLKKIIILFFILCINNLRAYQDNLERYKYNLVTDTLPLPPSVNQEQCQDVSNNDRLDCFPLNGASPGGCEARGCCWQLPKAEERKNLTIDPPNVPYCFYLPKQLPYKIINVTEEDSGVTAYLKRQYRSPYPNDIYLVKLQAFYETNSRLRIKLSDPNEQRFESPFPEITPIIKPSSQRMYRFKIVEQGFQVIRTEDNSILFDASDLTNFIFSDQLLQITTKLSSKHIYGIGETQTSFQLPTNGFSRYTLFNHDVSPGFNTNLYGSHPFYMVIDESTKAHGVFLKNANGMDVILQPTPALTFRTIGGILDFYYFLGPTPSDVIKQYQEVIGKPKMPPYWSLGFHLCRYGIKSLDATKEVLQRNLKAGIPVETQWNDLDYMKNANDFTYDEQSFAQLPEFVKELHEQGRRYVILIDPGVSGAENPGTYYPFDRGVELDVFVKNETGDIFFGKVWNPVSTVFPDFFHPNATQYWKEQLKKFYDVVPFDGAWIDMNEPSNSISGSIHAPCPRNELDYPPYVPGVDGDVLNFRTICMSNKHYGNTHYNLHNLYAIAEAKITSRVLSEILGERSLIISRATYAGQGAYGGHWSGDILSTWDDMKYSVVQLLDFSLYGIPLMGADICGFNRDTTPELCNRWMQLGAFYPFSRNHNSINQRDQDPAALGEQVIQSSRKALRIRYTLLPYLYTLFWKASTVGSTVARPLMVEFPEDKNTYNIGTQFLWGPALLIIPVLEENAQSVNGYLPKGIWYDYYSRKAIQSSGEYMKINAPLDTIPLYLRGGYIIPLQEAAETTTQARNSHYEILAALDEKQEAEGIFYWDDGKSVDVKNNYSVLHFSIKNLMLQISASPLGLPPPPLGAIIIIGINNNINTTLLENSCKGIVQYNKEFKTLEMFNLNITSYPFTINLA